MITLEGLHQPTQSGRQSLEVELHSQLDDSRLVGRLDLPERVAGHIQSEVFEVGLVEDVKAFKPELHSITFRKFEVLEERQIPTREAWPRDGAAPLVARQCSGMARIPIQDTVVHILDAVICSVRCPGVGVGELVRTANAKPLT